MPHFQFNEFYKIIIPPSTNQLIIYEIKNFAMRGLKYQILNPHIFINIIRQTKMFISSDIYLEGYKYQIHKLNQFEHCFMFTNMNIDKATE